MIASAVRRVAGVGPTWRIGQAGLLVAAALLLLAWDASGLDLRLAHLAGSAQGFPLREHWLLSNVLHDGVRRLSWLLALGLCLGVWWPLGPLARLPLAHRVQLAVSALAAGFAVASLKAASPTSCPWDLHDFGGVARYASHWSLLPDGGAGHCFPAGHASSGFCFIAGWFAFRAHDPAVARRWLLVALATGLVLGLAQQLRGAHFMSHTAWTAWVCWTIAWAADVGRERLQRGGAA